MIPDPRAIDGTFPSLNAHYELHLTAVECTLFQAVKATTAPKRQLGFSEFGQWQIPRLTAEYLLRCDGRTTHSAIRAALGFPLRVVVDQLAQNLAGETGVVTFQPAPSRGRTRLFVTGSFDSFAPLHMSIEITDTCNFACEHCYVTASPMKVGKRSYGAMIELFDAMRLNGVKIVELTGGECTTHPQFREILAAAAERFHLVAVLTNGYLLGKRDDLADYVASFNNVCVQISLDGTRETHDKFRNKPGSFDALCVGARRLTEQGVILRIAMTVTPDNVDEIEAVFLVAKAIGASALAVAPMASFGRGANRGGCAATDHHLQHEIAQRLAPHADDPLFDAGRSATDAYKATKQINCGAGWRSFALNGATGEVRSCLFLTDSKNFGSVDTEAYGDIFRSDYMLMFRDAPSPSESVSSCVGCSYLPECRGCFAKAFRVSEAEYPECPWRRRYFPGMSLTRRESGAGPQIIPLTYRSRGMPDSSANLALGKGV